MRRIDTRVPVLFILLLVAAPAASRPAVGEEDAPATVPDRAAVDEAIRRGVEYLKSEQSRDGSFDREAGSTGLALLALSHSGVDKEDRTIDRGVRWLLAGLTRPDTYGASLAIMALATIDRKLHARRIRRLAKLVAGSQCDNGQWSYQLRPGRSTGDNSNTQFAVISLWYARGAGAEIDERVPRRCREFFAGSQNEDGGWGYSARERTKSYGSMVATGLAALAFCRAVEAGLSVTDPKALDDPAIAAAKDWMQEHFAVDANPEADFKIGGGMRGVRKKVKDSYWRHYWLWSLERAATLAGVERFGDHDWYTEGAAALLAEQREDGSWVGSEAPLFATSFALLFLSRSTRQAVATEPPLPSGTTTPTPR